MPNQLNYTTTLTLAELHRPSRIDSKDSKLVISGKQDVLFGTRSKDNVEIWAYNPDGSLAGHCVARPDDDELGLVTILDNTGIGELLSVDLKLISDKMGLGPGRYSIVFNFFRDEVGSETGYKLIIKDISSDRTELRLQLIESSPSALADVFEFVVPSVPKIYAKGLIDQVFGSSLDVLEEEKVTGDKILEALNTIHADSGITSDRIVVSESTNEFNLLLEAILHNSLIGALDNMADDVNNQSIQESELTGYIEKAVLDVIYGMKNRGEIDPRFDVLE